MYLGFVLQRFIPGEPFGFVLFSLAQAFYAWERKALVSFPFSLFCPLKGAKKRKRKTFSSL
jgi:hypothetical protein